MQKIENEDLNKERCMEKRVIPPAIHRCNGYPQRIMAMSSPHQVLGPCRFSHRSGSLEPPTPRTAIHHSPSCLSQHPSPLPLISVIFYQGLWCELRERDQPVLTKWGKASGNNAGEGLPWSVVWFLPAVGLFLQPMACWPIPWAWLSSTDSCRQWTPHPQLSPAPWAWPLILSWQPPGRARGPSVVQLLAALTPQRLDLPFADSVLCSRSFHL